MSFPLCVMNLIVSFLWTAFGMKLDDSFITIPNMVGVFLSLIQISMFLIYGFPKTKTEEDSFV